MKVSVRASTGLEGIDAVIDGLRTEDNVVWQVDDAADYEYFAACFVSRALQENKKVTYMRFARHRALIKPDPRVTVCELNATSGFETFSTQVYSIITRQG